MAATVVDISPYAPTGEVETGTMTWSHTVTDTPNRLLLVWLSAENADGAHPGNSVTWSGVTYGGVSLTRAKAQVIVESSATVSGELWYLVNPAIGTASVVATEAVGDVSPASHCTGHAHTLRDAYQGAPEVVASTGNATDATTYSQSLTTLTANSLMLDLIATNREEAPTVGSGQTLVSSALDADGGGSGGQVSRTSSRATTTIGSYTQSWTFATAWGRAIQIVAAIAPASANSVSVTDLADLRVLQRLALTTGSVPVAATWAGATPSSAQARVMKGSSVIKDWTLVSVSGANITGTLTEVPVGDGYHIEVRTQDATPAVLASASGAHTWGIGKLFLVVGSSTPQKWFEDATAEDTDPLVRMYNGAWAACSGAAAVACGNAMVADEPGVPVGLLNYGESATTLAEWVSGDSNYDPAVAAVTALDGKIEGLIIHVGSNDARDGDIVSQSAHASNYRSLLANFRSDLGCADFLSALPVLIIGAQSSPADSSSLDQQWTWCRAAELDVADDDGNFMACEMLTMAIDDDDTHLTPAAMSIEGRRVARCYSSAILGLATPRRGPEPVSAAYDSVTGKIVVTFERFGGSTIVGRVAQVGITGFRVSTDNFSTVKSITGAPAVASANTVEMTVPTGLSGVKVDYLTGHDPDTSNCIFDNAAAPDA